MAESQSIAVVGAGGFAREVRWLIEDIDRSGTPMRFAGYIVSDRSTLTEDDDVERVIGEVASVETDDVEVDALALGIGSPAVRARIGLELVGSMPDMAWPALIHPSVQGDFETWTFGRGVLVCAGVVGTVNITLSDFAMVNINSTIGHEAKVGVGSVINPLVSISGGVAVGDRALIGTGANILQYVTVGNDATIGAGGVVTKDIPSGATAVGIPARPIGER